MAKNVTPPNADYDMPNMTAVASETKPLNHPGADYELANLARDARFAGSMLRRPTR
jgi:hypothetical protein